MGYFDPLGLLKAGPYGSTEDNFRRYREVEIKHGRVAMLATVGMLVQQNYSFEGYISPYSKPDHMDQQKIISDVTVK